jgi:hypothetical protein
MAGKAIIITDLGETGGAILVSAAGGDIITDFGEAGGVAFLVITGGDLISKKETGSTTIDSASMVGSLSASNIEVRLAATLSWK